MKYSMIPSVVITSVILMVGAEADILPNASEVGVLPESYADCISWAGADDSRGTLCDALESCERNESDDKQTLIDCIAEAKATFRNAQGSNAASPNDTSYIGKILPVGTAEQESIYEKQGNDSKGWKNAEQGF